MALGRQVLMSMALDVLGVVERPAAKDWRSVLLAPLPLPLSWTGTSYAKLAPVDNQVYAPIYEAQLWS